MLRETVGVMRDLPRLHEISSVFIRHGLGDLVRRIGIANVLERAGQILSWGARVESVRLEPAQRVRIALEELGPTFIKLGQVMATRVDLFPPNWIAEFEKLHSEVPPVPFESLRPELERALGRSPFEAFRDRDPSARPRSRRCTARSSRTARRSCSRSGARASARRSRPTFASCSTSPS
jgi:ubiquinone biosynthesis protein